MKTIEVINHYDGTKQTCFNLGMMSQEQGERIKAKIDGASFMKFRVIVAPGGGSWHISIDTFSAYETDEILGMLLHILASEL